VSKRRDWLVWLLVLAVVIVPALSFASTEVGGPHAQVKHGRSAPMGWRTGAVSAVEPTPPLRSPADLSAPLVEGRSATGFLASPFVPPRGR
jgi:hypothetical protein